MRQTATMSSCSAGICRSFPNNHGPQTDRLVYRLGAFKGYDSGDPTSREVGLYDQAFVDTLIHTLSNGGAHHRRPVRRSVSARREGHLRSRQPEHRTTSAASPARAAPPAKDVFTGFNVFSIALEMPISDIFPNGIPHNGAARRRLHRQPAPRVGEHQPPGDADRRRHATSSPASRAPATGCRSAATRCRCSMRASWARSVRRSICAPAR